MVRCRALLGFGFIEKATEQRVLRGRERIRHTETAPGEPFLKVLRQEQPLARGI
jgi:hypothetical protein